MARKAKVKKHEAVTGLSEQVTQRLKEGFFILTSAISLFVLLALLSYHRQDPGWSHIALVKHIANAGGRVGAYIADLILSLFGYFAYLFPVVLSYLSWLILREKNQTNLALNLLLMRLVGVIFVFVSGCVLMYLNLPQKLTFLPYTAGGILGQFIGKYWVAVFNKTGSILLMSAICLVGITLLTGVSWPAYVTQFYCWVRQCCRQLKSWIQNQLSQFKQRRCKTVALKKALPTIASQKSAPKGSKTVEDFPIKREEPKIIRSRKKEITEHQAPSFEISDTGVLPSISLLDPPGKKSQTGYTDEQLEQLSREVEQKLLDFGIKVQVVAVHPGPVITRFEIQLAPGVKASRITTLANDLARSLSMVRVRVVEVIAGKSVVGLELPNNHREMVRLSEILAAPAYQQVTSPLSLALGKDIAGHPVVVDLSKMPHLLVAGTTGAGKSVSLNAMLLSLLYKASPRNVRMILVDPKMLELSVYDGIPHLLTPVVTDMKEAVNALRWCVAEMERRYRLMAALKVRNMAGFNKKIIQGNEKNEPIKDPIWRGENEEERPNLEELPYIVVVIDELADMMMVVGKKVEQLIARIAQKARAAGIHLILATQRPSVDVITGLIKSNIPTRIAFQVSSKIDSRTILDQSGAEQLLGHGDMLYLPPGTGMPIRVHGAFVDDHEVHHVTADWKARSTPVYIEEILNGPSDESGLAGIPGEESDDPESDELYDEAVAFVVKSRRASISAVQRRLKIGYNRSARLVEAMEKAGIVSSMEGSGAREVLVPAGSE